MSTPKSSIITHSTMASSKPPKRDRFAYFDGDLDDSGDESDEEAENDAETKERTDFISKPTDSDENVALPSAKEILDATSKPEFLRREKKDIDWELIARNDIRETDPDIDTHAIPPPNSYAPQTDNLKVTLGDPVSGNPTESDKDAQPKSKRPAELTPTDSVSETDPPKKKKT